MVLAFETLANPSIRIGGTLAKCGPTSELSVLVDDALQWWANSINARGGVLINGTLHIVEFFMCVGFSYLTVMLTFFLLATTMLVMWIYSVSGSSLS